MSKTIRVIDLLNKIANGEEAPKKIKFNEDIFEYYPSEKEYKSWVDEDRFMGQTLLFAVMNEHYINEILNETVEIIEDQEVIDIQGLAEIPGLIHALSSEGIGENIDILVNQCNYLVQAVKQLDKKMEEKNNGIK